jgi:hypothetical protein
MCIQFESKDLKGKPRLSGEFINQLSDSQLLKKVFAPWS